MKKKQVKLNSFIFAWKLIKKTKKIKEIKSMIDRELQIRDSFIKNQQKEAKIQKNLEE